jgi:hypothetical protein
MVRARQWTTPMTKLPVVFNEAAAVEEVAAWVEVVQAKMMADYSREWLEAALCDYLRQGLIETLRIFGKTG